MISGGRVMRPKPTPEAMAVLEQARDRAFRQRRARQLLDRRLAADRDRPRAVAPRRDLPLRRAELGAHEAGVGAALRAARAAQVPRAFHLPRLAPPRRGGAGVRRGRGDARRHQRRRAVEPRGELGVAARASFFREEIDTTADELRRESSEAGTVGVPDRASRLPPRTPARAVSFSTTYLQEDSFRSPAKCLRSPGPRAGRARAGSHGAAAGTGTARASGSAGSHRLRARRPAGQPLLQHVRRRQHRLAPAPGLPVLDVSGSWDRGGYGSSPPPTSRG